VNEFDTAVPFNKEEPSLSRSPVHREVLVVDAQVLDTPSPARYLTVGNASASSRRRVKQSNTKDGVIAVQKEAELCLHPTTGPGRSNTCY
jgi:hypothetical protein